MLRRTEYDYKGSFFWACHADRNWNPVDSHMCRRHLVKLLRTHTRRVVSSALLAGAQVDRILFACLASTSKKVCGSVALTPRLGSVTGKAMPNRPRLPMF